MGAKFKLMANPTFTAKVAIPSSGDQPAGEITFTFKHKTKTELLAYYEQSKSKTAVQCVVEIVAGWDVLDENDKPVEFNEATALALFENYHSAWGVISDAYMLQLTKFKLGN